MSAHYFLDAIIALLCSFAGYLLFRRTSRLRGLVVFAIVMVWVQVALSTVYVANLLDHNFVQWTRCLGLISGGLLLYCAAVSPLLRRAHAFDPERRNLLRAGVVAAAAVPVAVGGFAF